MSKILTLLVAAKSLLLDPKSWTKGAYARNEEGHSVLPVASDASCFCMLGALIHEQRRMGESWSTYCDANNLLDGLLKTEGVAVSVPDFNDNRSRQHEEVLALFDKAIEKAKLNGG